MVDALSALVAEAAPAERYGAARQAADAGTKVAGFTCSYAPQELLHAAGYAPVRILSRTGGTPRSDELLQAFACSLARSVLDSALAGEFDFLSLVVFSHTCDTMQNVADLWRRNRPQVPALIASLPTRVDGPLPRAYYRCELGRLCEELAALGTPVTDDALWKSIALYQEHRGLMRKLYALRRAKPGLLNAADTLRLVTASFLMPREAHRAIVLRAIEMLEAAEPPPPLDKPKVLLAGSVCHSPDFLSTIEGAGCAIVDDDLCMGSRAFAMAEAPDGDPLDALAEMYLSRTPCPAFHHPDYQPGEAMLARAKEAEADGVVLLLTKFCDPWGFEYPPINNALTEAGIPVLALEVEQHLPPPEQLRTRAEAFAELLQAKAGR